MNLSIKIKIGIINGGWDTDVYHLIRKNYVNNGILEEKSEEKYEISQ